MLGAGFRIINTAFHVALKKAGITNFRFHDLRHTFASWLVMDGASLMEIKELLGHHDITMTMRYAHLAPDRLRDAVGRLDRVFFGAEQDAPARQLTSALLAARR